MVLLTEEFGGLAGADTIEEKKEKKKKKKNKEKKKKSALDGLESPKVAGTLMSFGAHRFESKQTI